MILNLCLVLYISCENFTLFMLMILRLIKTCKGPIKILKGPLILVHMCLNGIFAVVHLSAYPHLDLVNHCPIKTEHTGTLTSTISTIVCDKYRTYIDMYKLAF